MNITRRKLAGFAGLGFSGLVTAAAPQEQSPDDSKNIGDRHVIKRIWESWEPDFPEIKGCLKLSVREINRMDHLGALLRQPNSEMLLILPVITVLAKTLEYRMTIECRHLKDERAKEAGALLDMAYGLPELGDPGMGGLDGSEFDLKLAKTDALPNGRHLEFNTVFSKLKKEFRDFAAASRKFFESF